MFVLVDLMKSGALTMTDRVCQINLLCLQCPASLENLTSEFSCDIALSNYCVLCIDISSAVTNIPTFNTARISLLHT